MQISITSAEQSANEMDLGALTGPEPGPTETKSAVHEVTLEKYITDLMSAGAIKADILTMALLFNAKHPQPKTSDEILALVESVATPELCEMSDLDLLKSLAEKLILFKDDLSEPCFFCEGETFRAPSKEVMARIKHKFFLVRKYMPSAGLIKIVFEIQESRARFDGLTIKLFNRVGSTIGHIFYDMGDNRFVKITPTCWEVVSSFPLFRRFKHQQQQTDPVSGGNPWLLFKYLPIPEEHQLIILVYIVALFIPEIAHPILSICGDKGSAKSFVSNTINRLVDPTLTEKVIQPKNERDLIQTLRQKYLTVLDNISVISDRVSDILCQVCTGTSISYRKLYTDDGENIAQFRHAVIINSIGMPIINADLMDRSIILKLTRIPDSQRKPEQDILVGLEACRPEILGGIFDTIAKAMAIYPILTIKELPRLADFAKWGYAIAEALGKSGEQFLKDFSSNVARQNESVTQNNVLCQAIINYMSNRTAEFQKVADIHTALKKLVDADAKDKTFPKLPHNMRNHLGLLRPTLLENGITYEYFDRQKDGVKILLTKTGTPGTSASSAAIIPQNDNIFVNLGVADEADEPTGATPVIEFDDVVEVVNG
jgi:hypothetical protein